MKDLRSILDDIQQDLTGEADGLSKLARAETVLDDLQVGSEDWLSFKAAIANIYGRLPGRNRAGHLDRSIELYEEVLTYRTRENDYSAWARTQHNLGTAWRDRSNGNLSENREKALECYLQAQSAYRFERDRFEWGAVQGSIGNVYSVRRKGDPHANYELAIKHLGLALKAFTPEFAARQHARTKANLARLYFRSPTGDKRSNIEQAIKHGRDGLETISHLPGNYDHVNLHMVVASAYRRRLIDNKVRNFEKAMEHYRLAETILDRAQQPGEWARLRFNMAIAHREQPYGDNRANRPRAIELLLESLEVWKPDKFPREWFKAQQALANTYAHIREWQEVIRIADEVINEARNRLTLIDDLYERRRLLASIGPVKNLKVLGLARTKGAVAALTALREHRADLLGRHASVAMAENAAGQMLISSDTAKLFFCVQPLEGEPTLVFLITKTEDKPRLEMFDLPELSNRDLEKLLERDPVNPELAWMAGYERFKSENNLGAFMASMDCVIQELSERLKPLLVRLAGLPSTVEQLHISPSGGLAILPFSAFILPGTANQIVVDRFAVTYETGLPLEIANAERSLECSELLAVVDPRNNLQFARTEAEAVSRSFVASESLRGSKATKANVTQAISKLGPNAHLHFICHGHYAWREPEVSHMEMANDESFSLSEIAQTLQLPKGSSVVLSACETGLNEFKELPEESYGLPVAFFAAGARSVLSPLWPVSDFMTAKLMARYYEALAKGKSSSAALRQAQLALREYPPEPKDTPDGSLQIRWGQKTGNTDAIDSAGIDLRHPFFWAGFILQA